MLEEKYYVDFDLAENLKEFGFPQDNCDAYWCKTYIGDGTTVMHDLVCKKTRDTVPFEEETACPSVGFLRDLLKEERLPIYKKESKKWIVGVRGILITEEKEANALALQWITLQKQ